MVKRHKVTTDRATHSWLLPVLYKVWRECNDGERKRRSAAGVGEGFM